MKTKTKNSGWKEVFWQWATEEHVRDDDSSDASLNSPPPLRMRDRLFIVAAIASGA